MRKSFLILPILFLTSCYYKEINYLNNEVSSLRQDFNHMNESLEARIHNLEIIASANREDTQKNAADRGALATDIRTEMENLKGSFEELEHKLTKRIEPLEREIAKLVVENEKNKESSDEHSSEKKNVEESIQSLKNDIATLKKNYTDQLATIKQKIDALLKSAAHEKTKKS